MKRLSLVVALMVAVGCKSSPERPDRDYTSVNRESVDFLFETIREGNKVRKQNLKRDLAFSKRAPQNRHIRKTSVQSAWEAFWVEEWNGVEHIVNAREVERKDRKERLYSIRFGFLDSGD